ncbi:hypothetical protein FE257_006927 [Aspergillus nanangensis]|uniref:SMP-30/Gluconolactonase/LRE-like region domain-containing protein n=1 Tax=Aspergillus nanangensis TaxID=2582783 RepID=A0AAD4CNZ9_ASPNN|nr:hypothetical protein FE257_006927 [Aspergillus nanangensis]
MHSLVLWGIFSSLATSTLAQSTTQLFNFSSYVDIENSVLRPNGHLLLTTFDKGRLYDLDPHSPSPAAKLVATFPGSTAITGIAPIGDDKFAVSGGVRGSYHYDNETIYTIDMRSNGTVDVVAKLGTAIMLNGMASLPSHPHIVLSADSRVGVLWRVDTHTGTTNLALQDDYLMAPENSSVPIGVNGLKVVGGYVYFTNTARGIFARLPVSDDGVRFGQVHVIAHSDGYSWDDFILDTDGAAYVAQSNNAVVKILPSGEKMVVAGGSESMALIGPTSLVLDDHETVLYVTTRGGTVDGVEYSGQVVKVELPKA